MWGLLADPERLRVFGALALGSATVPEICATTDLSTRVVLAALAKLEAGDVVRVTGERWCVDRSALVRHARESAAVPYEEEGLSPRYAAVLRAFLREGRLTSIPTSRAKRLVVLDHVAKVFEPGTQYPEREVDVLLRAFHDDHAALRRYLVDEGFLARAEGVYWRIGGSVQV